jgi:hypothetical protein
MRTITSLEHCRRYAIAPSQLPRSSDEDGKLRYWLVLLPPNARVEYPGYVAPAPSAPKPPRVPRDDAEGAVWGVAGVVTFVVVTGTLMILGLASAAALALNVVRSALGG